MLNKSISISAQVDSLSDQAALLFTWMIAHADDEGRMMGAPKYIKATVVPLRSGRKWSEHCIQGYILQLEATGLVHYWYQMGTRYIQFPTWKDHQVIQADRAQLSKIPPYNPEKALKAEDLPEPPNSASMETKNILDVLGVDTQYSIVEYSIVEYSRKEALWNRLLKGRQTPTEVKLADPRIKKIIDYFFESVKTLKGFEPEINGGRDGWLIRRRLENYSETQLKDLIDIYLKSDVSGKLGCSLSVILSAAIINQWLGGQLQSRGEKIAKMK